MIELLDRLSKFSLANVYGLLEVFAFIGFLVCVIFIINLNHHAFVKIFKDRSQAYWWVFIIVSAVPLVFVFLAFSFFFTNREKVDPTSIRAVEGMTVEDSFE